MKYLAILVCLLLLQGCAITLDSKPSPTYDGPLIDENNLPIDKPSY